MTQRVFRIQGAAGIRPAFVAAWKLIGQLMREAESGYELVLRPIKSKRSMEQNKRYWKLLAELQEVAYLDGRQYGKDAWHEYLRREFIGCIDLPGGGVIGMSTTTLSIDEFTDYMTRIEAWAAQQGWPLMMEDV